MNKTAKTIEKNKTIVIPQTQIIIVKPKQLHRQKQYLATSQLKEINEISCTETESEGLMNAQVHN